MTNYTSSSTIDLNAGNIKTVTSWFTNSTENVPSVQYNDLTVAVYNKTKNTSIKSNYCLNSDCIKMEEAVYIDKTILFGYKNCSN
jgi:hypothetical protein